MKGLCAWVCRTCVDDLFGLPLVASCLAVLASSHEDPLDRPQLLPLPTESLKIVHFSSLVRISADAGISRKSRSLFKLNNEMCEKVFGTVPYDFQDSAGPLLLLGWPLYLSTSRIRKSSHTRVLGKAISH